MNSEICTLMEINPKPRCELLSVAHKHDVAVIDDVYVDWRRLAQSVRKLRFEPALGGFPGMRISLRAGMAVLEGLVAATLASNHLILAQQKIVFSLLGPLATFNKEQHVPHRDADVELSGVIYLCDRASGGEGTGFYRHRPSGLTGAFIFDPCFEATVQASPFGSIDEFLADLSRVGPNDSIYGAVPSLTWELVEAIELRPNRLVLFDSRLFHAALAPRSESTRLTQNLFLRAEPRQSLMRFRAPAGAIGAFSDRNA